MAYTCLLGNDTFGWWSRDTFKPAITRSESANYILTSSESYTSLRGGYEGAWVAGISWRLRMYNYLPCGGESTSSIDMER